MKIEIEPKELVDFVLVLQNRLANSKCDSKEVAKYVDIEMKKLFNNLFTADNEN